MTVKFLKLPYFIKKFRYRIILIAVCIILVTGTVIIKTTANDNKGIFLPIIMYHNITKDDTKAGDYSISTVQLEKDLMYLEDNGYTSVTVSDLINYIDNNVALPQKPVMITFDDGFLNNMTYGLPLLKKYNMKAVISIVGAYTQKFTDTPDSNPHYAYLSWRDITRAKHCGHFEIQSHSYNMHEINSKRKGARINKNENFRDYQSAFISDAYKVSNGLLENCNIKVTTYTYPYGFYCKESEEILHNLHYRCSLTCNEKPNYITKDPECLFLLGRYNRPQKLTTEQYMKKLLKE